MLFFGASTVYISPRTNPLLKHGLTAAGTTAGTAAVVVVGTVTIGVLWFLENYKK
jgi:hypothetical protein